MGLALCVLLMSFFAKAAPAQTKLVRYQVSLPHIGLKTDLGERIESVAVVIHCGRFVAITSIPDDWSVDIVSPVSEKTTLKMEAGHGSSEIWHSEDLSKFLTISSLGDSCFDIAATVKTNFYEGSKRRDRKIPINQKELILAPNPSSAVQSLHR